MGDQDGRISWEHQIISFSREFPARFCLTSPVLPVTLVWRTSTGNGGIQTWRQFGHASRKKKSIINTKYLNKAQM